MESREALALWSAERQRSSSSMEATAHLPKEGEELGGGSLLLSLQPSPLLLQLPLPLLLPTLLLLQREKEREGEGEGERERGRGGERGREGERERGREGERQRGREREGDGERGERERGREKPLVALHVWRGIQKAAVSFVSDLFPAGPGILLLRCLWVVHDPGHQHVHTPVVRDVGWKLHSGNTRNNKHMKFHILVGKESLCIFRPNWIKNAYLKFQTQEIPNLM